MMELATGSIGTGNIGIGNTSTLATLNNDRFLIIDDKELFLAGASLKDLALGRKSAFAADARADGLV